MRDKARITRALSWIAKTDKQQGIGQATERTADKFIPIRAIDRLGVLGRLDCVLGGVNYRQHPIFAVWVILVAYTKKASPTHARLLCRHLPIDWHAAAAKMVAANRRSFARTSLVGALDHSESAASELARREQQTAEQAAVRLEAMIKSGVDRPGTAASRQGRKSPQSHRDTDLVFVRGIRQAVECRRNEHA